jgi:hypothetical protein
LFAIPLKKRFVQLLFQRLDMHNNSRLSQVQLYVSTGEDQLQSHLDKAPKLIQFHRSSILNNYQNHKND